MLRRPLLGGPKLAGGVVVQDCVDGPSEGYRRFDLVEKRDELLASAVLGMASDDRSVQNVRGSKTPNQPRPEPEARPHAHASAAAMRRYRHLKHRHLERLLCSLP